MTAAEILKIAEARPGSSEGLTRAVLTGLQKKSSEGDTTASSLLNKISSGKTALSGSPPSAAAVSPGGRRKKPSSKAQALIDKKQKQKAKKQQLSSKITEHKEKKPDASAAAPPEPRRRGVLLKHKQREQVEQKQSQKSRRDALKGLSKAKGKGTTAGPGTTPKPGTRRHKKEEARQDRVKENERIQAEAKKKREKDGGPSPKKPSGPGGTKSERRKQKEQKELSSGGRKKKPSRGGKKKPSGSGKAEQTDSKKGSLINGKWYRMNKEPVTVSEVVAYSMAFPGKDRPGVNSFENKATGKMVGLQTVSRGKGRNENYARIYEKMVIPAVMKWRNSENKTRSKAGEDPVGANVGKVFSKGKGKSTGKGKSKSKTKDKGKAETSSKKQPAGKGRGKGKGKGKGKDHPMVLPEAKGRKPGFLQKVKEGIGDFVKGVGKKVKEKGPGVAKALGKGIAKGTGAAAKGIAKGTAATVKAVGQAGKRVVEGPTVETVGKRDKRKKEIKKKVKEKGSAAAKSLKKGLVTGIQALTTGRKVTLSDDGEDKKKHPLDLGKKASLTYKEASAKYPLALGGPEVAYRMIRVAHKHPKLRTRSLEALHNMAMQRKAFTHRLAHTHGEEFGFTEEDLHKAAADIKDCYGLFHEDFSYLFM